MTALAECAEARLVLALHWHTERSSECELQSSYASWRTWPCKRCAVLGAAYRNSPMISNPLGSIRSTFADQTKERKTNTHVQEAVHTDHFLRLHYDQVISSIRGSCLCTNTAILH
eukprot:scpid26132/ scgid31986/ 